MIIELTEKHDKKPVYVETAYITGMKRIKGDADEYEEDYTRLDMTTGRCYKVMELPEDIMAAGENILIEEVIDIQADVEDVVRRLNDEKEGILGRINRHGKSIWERVDRKSRRNRGKR